MYQDLDKKDKAGTAWRDIESRLIDTAMVIDQISIILRRELFTQAHQY